VCQIDPLLQDAVAQSASDIHLTAEQPPIFRVHGQLVRQGKVAFSAADLETMLLEILPADRREEFQLKGQADFSYAIAGLGRFRVNAYRQRNHVALALRTIPFRIQPLHELGLPEVVAGLCDKPHGLVVVTGPTGSGKSTTLASMVDLINGKYAHHIITLEDPIEFLHRHRLSIINQREIGQDCPSFALGLRAALRQNPNVILIGEMRDLETIAIALQAAETGHLVLATLHTNDAASTVDRIIDVFPPEQQQQVRVQLGGCLQGIVAQRLFTRKDRTGRIGAFETLIATPAVRNLIREGKTHQIPSVIQTSGKLGMRLMEDAVKELYAAGRVAQEDYQQYVSETTVLQQQGYGAAPLGYHVPRLVR
jgi:twitching motility protein PilT